MRSRSTILMVLVIVVSGVAGAQSTITRPEMVNDLFHSAPHASIVSTDNILQESLPAAEEKSVSLAALYSLLLPGMGELYVGDYGMGKYFTIAEGGLWTMFGGAQWYANWLQNDSRAFAAQHAGFSLDGKSDQYFIDVGNFSSAQAFDEQVRRDRNYYLLYDQNSSMNWKWDNSLNQSIYRDRRISSEQMFNNTRFIVAAIGVNHVVSALNAARLAVAHNKHLGALGSIDIRAKVVQGPNGPDGLMVGLAGSF